MVQIFQKLTAPFSEKFLKEPSKKFPPQDPPKWSHRTKTALVALTTFSSFGASYLAYRSSSPKFNVPVSSISSPIRTAFKTIGSLTGLGLLAYFFNSRTQIPEAQTKTSEEEKDLISSKSTSQQVQTPTKTSDKRKTTKSDINEILSSVYKSEKIDKIILEKTDQYIY